ncbi:hypothetical protein AND_000234 [Anopheles darlingi]|uniref:Uncharacterized protein n=1 Tax=Anopheles darlingi TaxID=43151 RepID=W5JWE8_ANODA|nr:hypothetical protein AND_000234 [Anopheles darlingi]
MLLTAEPQELHVKASHSLAHHKSCHPRSSPSFYAALFFQLISFPLIPCFALLRRSRSALPSTDGNQDSAGGSKPAAAIHHHQHLQHVQQSQQEATLVVPLGTNGAGSVAANSTDNLLLGVEGRSAGAPTATAGTGAGVPPNGQNVVSPSVMAKFLEDELKSSDGLLLGMSSIKHCDTCVCTRIASAGAGESLSVHNNNRSSGSLLLADLLGSEQRSYSVATQTLIRGETNNSLCLRCNSNLNSPSHNNSPYIMKLIKSSDSVISETKSSVSDYLTTPDKVSPSGAGGGGGACDVKTNGDSAASGDGGSMAMAGHGDVLSSTSSSNNDHSEPRSMLVPTKKDDLMVNPILGHHRLSIDRNASLSPGSEHQGTAKGATYTTGKFSGLVVTKKPSVAPLDTFKAAKLTSASGVTAPQTTPTSTTSTTAGGGGGGGAGTGQSKFTNDSPSYIIKDTDQMSGHHMTPKSSLGGHGAGLQSKFGGTSGGSGSVGSGLYHHAIGSTNSLWSRTSSKDPEKDGAKMFEIFNRNLIKTIKAENPKMSGPRICALRIQNGSSNILLDNLLDDALEGNDSKPTTPVMYTRRAKFLDEELLLDDDPSIGLNGAIKTTPLPTATSSDSTAITASSKSVPIVTPAKGPPGASGVANVQDQLGELGATGTPVTKSTASALHRVDEGGGGGDGAVSNKQQSCNMSTTTSPHSSDRLCTIGEEVSNLLINTKLTTSAMTPKPRPDINVNKLDGIDVTSKKSCTHSSSISSEIDIQESAILRRQQLSRVAEWVQNNSKLGNPMESNTESDSEPLLLANGPPVGGHTLTDSLNNNNGSSTIGSVFPIATKGGAPARTALPGTRHMMQSFPRTTHNNSNISNIIISSSSSSSMATNQLNNNQSVTSFAQIGTIPSTTIGGGGLDYNSNGTPLQTTASGLGAIRKGSTYGTAMRPQYHRGGNSAGSLTEALLDEANRIVQEAESRRRIETQAAEDRRDRLLDYEEDDRNSVDLAQMEYNVKQFLLKQNEWSTVHTRRQSAISSTSSVRAAAATGPSFTSGITSGPRISEAREPTKGLFPGTAVPQTAISNQYHHRSTSSSNNNNNNNNNMYPINPHRTETNL